MKIWNIPIESLEERYSKDWNEWIPSFFESNNIEYETIWGSELTNKIEQGAFLDVIGTNYYKSFQIHEICYQIYKGNVKDGDVFFFNDLWFPGLETLAYIRNALGLKFKIAGVLHAGTWDKHDFLSAKGMTPWAEHLENSWFEFIDMIFVATGFHKKLIVRNRKVAPYKIKVTGLPIYDIHSDTSVTKENIVVFPHRLDEEKHPELFDKLANTLKETEQYKDWQFIKTKEVCNTKKEYYDLLNRSKIAVSFADQETWGIAMQEALFAECIPFVPGKLSYQELYCELLRFTSINYLVTVFLGLDIRDYDAILRANKQYLLSKGAAALSNIVEHLRNL